MEFVQARHYHATRTVDTVVVHRAECPMETGKALAVANYFAGEASPVASAHYVVDPLDVVQCVREEDIAYHAPPNVRSVGVELCGYSADTDWETGDGITELSLAADLVASVCRRWGVPAVWLSAEDLKEGKRGITGHREVSEAFRKSDHTDPGDAFPREAFAQQVAMRLEGGTP